jgi:hypothetical protein
MLELLYLITELIDLSPVRLIVEVDDALDLFNQFETNFVLLVKLSQCAC